MNNNINLKIIVAIIISFGLIESTPATACNRTAGCAMDVLHENYEMMHSDKMSKAMREGQDNIAAFRRLQEAERAAVRR